MTGALSAELQARAFVRQCGGVGCAGRPILASDALPAEVRDAISGFAGEVEYIDLSKIDDLYGPDGRFSDGTILIEVSTVHSTERDDVLGVDVTLVRGFMDVKVQTYLFLWDGTEWVDTSPDAVDVTVTTGVS